MAETRGNTGVPGIPGGGGRHARRRARQRPLAAADPDASDEPVDREKFAAIKGRSRTMNGFDISGGVLADAAGLLKRRNFSGL
ncbi:MAG: hypothetical protein CMM77_02930 [Rhodospirillaceae bacterium]|nr:hypothetical protein [Magnetovibrio sp.]MAY66065.1 hypothetical protein [Rhodospirillaceae bacterium]